VIPSIATESRNGSRATALTPVLEARGIHKRYGHVHALRGANFAAYSGEIVALVGDNGAGKSTLIKVLSGVERPDGGEIHHDGRPVAIGSPSAARDLGIETVYQDLALAEDLDPTTNLFMGRELLRSGPLGRLGVEDKKAMRRRPAQAFADLGVDVDISTRAVASLSGGQRQSVAVTRAVMWASRIVILDEPTAALAANNTNKVLDLMRRIADRGLAVILISHDLPHVVEVADRVEVLRLGRRVARFSKADVSADALLAAMTGALVHEEA
jgi:simple sugar transport system ATP-binding protein